MTADLKNTLRGADLGKSAGDAKNDDLERGYYDAAPGDSYEGSLEPGMPVYDIDSGKVIEKHRGTMRPGSVEPDSDFERRHGQMDEYGFVRRPTYRGDVERQ